ncbi:hypothetical protein C8R47DRAFT_1120352, partial [Mycena vitilis]
MVSLFPLPGYRQPFPFPFLMKPCRWADTNALAHTKVSRCTMWRRAGCLLICIEYLTLLFLRDHGASLTLFFFADYRLTFVVALLCMYTMYIVSASQLLYPRRVGRRPVSYQNIFSPH